MKCDRCELKNATIHITKVENGNKTELNLCEDCAIQEGILYSFVPERVSEKKPAQLQCRKCGLTHADFMNRGMLGCSECYQSFRPVLMPIIEKIQGARTHRGRACSPGQEWKDGSEKGNEDAGSELQQLRDMLEEAIMTERYEDAAVLRDRIRELVATGSSKQTPEES